MALQKPVTEIIKRRYSCRSYTEEHISGGVKEKLETFIEENAGCPFNSEIRFKLASAEKGDSEVLKGLGTYGFIKNPAGFIIGGMKKSGMCLEDYGYLMEKNILYATGLGLGNCWIGGSFKRSNFSKRMGALNDEDVPAVASLGYVSDKKTFMDRAVMYSAGSMKRKPWRELFFEQNFDTPLQPDDAGAYGEPLEMLRIAPSASNRQPWRIVKEKDGNIFHFYLERNKGYTRTIRILRLADLQRIDMGIAMAHFELTSLENNLKGKWEIADPETLMKDGIRRYVASWFEQK